MEDLEIKKTKRTLLAEERQSQIVELYTQLRQKYPDVKKDRIATTIAESMSMSKPGVYGILKRAGVKEFYG